VVNPDGVAPSRMVGVSASVNLPLHHKVQKFASGTGSPGWSRIMGRKTVVVWCSVWCWYPVNNLHKAGDYEIIMAFITHFCLSADLYNV